MLTHSRVLAQASCSHCHVGVNRHAAECELHSPRLLLPLIGCQWLQTHSGFHLKSPIFLILIRLAPPAFTPERDTCPWSPPWVPPRPPPMPAAAERAGRVLKVPEGTHLAVCLPLFPTDLLGDVTVRLQVSLAVGQGESQRWFVVCAERGWGHGRKMRSPLLACDPLSSRDPLSSCGNHSPGQT